MEPIGLYTYTSASTDRPGRNAEIEGLKARLEASFGPGRFRMERAPDPEPTGPRSEIPTGEFSNTIRYRWKVRA